MADTGKKEFEAKLDADPRKEMTKAVVDFVDGDKALKKLVVNFTFSEKVQLDPRKWSKNELNRGVYSAVRYEIQIFANRLAQMVKAGTSGKDAATEIKALHAKTQKYIDKKMALAIEELASDEPDNKKALKDGKKAMAKIDALDLKDTFSKPRGEVIGLMEAIVKAKDKGADAAVKKAAEAVSKLAGEFDKTGREAGAAIGYLLKVIKDNKNSETQELKDFSKLADGKTSTFQTFVDECKEFEDALDDLVKSLKGGKMDADGADAKATAFENMTAVDASAKDALKEAKALKGDFDKIIKALK